MAVQPGEIALYVDETPVPIEPVLNGVGEYRYQDITRIECAFLCPQCETEQYIESRPPLGPNQSYPCGSCNHVIEITPEWTPPEEVDEPGFARRALRRILPFSNRIAPRPDPAEEDRTPPRYHVEHLMEFLLDMELRRSVRRLGEQNPSEALGLMMRLRTTERVSLALAVVTLVALLLSGVWLFPGVALSVPIVMVFMFVGGSILFLLTESAVIPQAALARVRTEHDIPDVIDGSLFMRYADYYRYGHQRSTAPDTDIDTVEHIPVIGVEYEPAYVPSPPEQSSAE
jgi:hypothetical protein